MESVTSGYGKHSWADYDSRRTNRRASDDCGMSRFSPKRVSESASSWLVLDCAPPRRQPCCSPGHSIEREHVSRRQREASTEPARCTQHAAPPASECRRQAVETVARPVDDPGPVKARLLDGGATRRTPSRPGLLAEEPLGNSRFASFFSFSLLLTRELFMTHCLKGRRTSSLTGGDGQSGIEPGFSHDAEQQTANIKRLAVRQRRRVDDASWPGPDAGSRCLGTLECPAGSFRAMRCTQQRLGLGCKR